MTKPRTNSPRGLFWKEALGVGATGMFFRPYSTTTALVDSNTTGLTVAGQVRVNNQQYISADSTAWGLQSRAALPTVNQANDRRIAAIKDSTGRFNVAVNSTGTTWKFMRFTAVITG